MRTFLAFVDTGSLTRAAEIVGRSPSAVTSQMQRLENTVGLTLLEPSGRGRGLTRVGEELVSHARRILDTHRQALLSLRGTEAAGRLSIGATQDFAEVGLPPLLRLFASTHPRIALEIRIGRSAELREAFDRNEIDLLLIMREGTTADEIGTLIEPMIWQVSAEGLVSPGDDVPLALLDAPCEFRNAALAALVAAGRTYRITATSQSLAGLRAAVAAGFAVTLRTPRWLCGGVVPAPPSLHLPRVGAVTFVLRVRRDAPPPAYDLGRLLADGLIARPAIDVHVNNP